LRERSAEKRTRTIHHRYGDLHRLELTTREVESLLHALGRQPPVDPSRLVSALLDAVAAHANATREE
jgi:hypothetical protein